MYNRKKNILWEEFLIVMGWKGHIHKNKKALAFEWLVKNEDYWHKWASRQSEDNISMRVNICLESIMKAAIEKGSL